MRTIIGLEIHVELKTKSKMFCGCSTDHFGKTPNTLTCPVCLGLPGALPVPNQKAIEWSLLAGLALGCQTNSFSKFDRKSYFYPDLPKGYQISQYDLPFSYFGAVKIEKKKVGITRVHLEEDTAKLIHQGGSSLIDFNRSGVPLVEIVTEPEIDSPELAKAFLKELQTKLRYLEISDCDMEKGSMRLEVNISLSQNNQLPDYKVEIKNLNSFRFVERAIRFEMERQKEILAQGKVPIQETRGWNSKTQSTYSQRQKEEAKDYRYFPEPDIPPINLKTSSRSERPFDLEQIRKQLPELPREKEIRFQKDYGLRPDQARILSQDLQTAVFFDRATKIARGKGLEMRTVANVMINKKVDWRGVSPKDLVEQFLKADQRKILIGSALKKVVNQVIEDNPKPVADFKKGQQGAIEFLVGLVMKVTKGQADPNQVRQEISRQLA